MGIIARRLALTAITLVFAVASSARADVLLSWETAGLAGNEASLNSSVTATGLAVSTLTRGAGITAVAGANRFNSNQFNNGGTRTIAINGNDYLTFAVTNLVDKPLSLSTLDAFFTRVSTGPNTFEWQYSLDNFATAGVTIGSSFSFTSLSGSAPQMNLTGIGALQNINPSTTVTFRLYGWGATNNTAGHFAIGGGAGPDLVLTGVLPEPASAALVAIGLALLGRRRSRSRH